MFALLETEMSPKPSLSRRIASVLGREPWLDVWEDRMLGAPMLRIHLKYHAGLSPRRRLDRLEAALEEICSAGIRGVVLPDGFEEADFLEEFGLAPANPVGLYRRLAGRIALQALEGAGIEPSNASVCIVTSRVTADVNRAASGICTRVRQLSICSDAQEGLLARALRREYGLSVMENPNPAWLQKTDLFLVFDIPASYNQLPVGERSSVVLLGDHLRSSTPLPRKTCNGITVAPPERLKAFWPHECDTTALVAALWAVGGMGPEEIAITGLHYDGRPVFDTLTA